MNRRNRCQDFANLESGVLQRCLLLHAPDVTVAPDSTLDQALHARRPKKSHRRAIIEALTAAGYTHASVDGNRATPVRM